jgi:hypothetical protein
VTAGRFVVVLVLALLGATGAFWLSLQRHLPRDASFGPSALPGLAGELPAVDRVTITAGDGRRVTLDRRGESFGIGEFDGYPADRQRLQSLLTALADLHLASRDIGRDVGQDGAVTVTLSGRMTPRLIRIGPAAGPDTAYVRIGPATTTGIAGPAPPLDAEARHWLATPLLDIADDEVSRLVYHADTAPLDMARPARGARFTWAGTRSGSPMPEALATAPATLAVALPVLGARAKTDDLPFGPQTLVETFGGLRLEFAGRTRDGQHWLRFRAATVPAPGAADDDAERARRLAARLQLLGTAFEVEIPAERYATLFPAAD